MRKFVYIVLCLALGSSCSLFEEAEPFSMPQDGGNVSDEDAGTSPGDASTCPDPCVETLVVTPNPISISTGGRIELDVRWQDPIGNTRPAEFEVQVLPDSIATAQNGAIIGTESGRGKVVVTSEEQFVEIDLQVTARWTHLAAGLDHMCGTVESGETYCWGEVYSRALGTGYRIRSRIAAPTNTSKSFEGLCAQSRATIAIDRIGDLYGWGYARGEQIGRYDWNGYDSPIGASTDAKFARIDCGVDHACGIRVDGTLGCWGPNTYGEVNPTDVGRRTAQHQIDEGSGAPASEFVDVAAGAFHTCAAGTSGGVWCWGDNSAGQFPRQTNSTFVEVLSVDTLVKDLTAGLNHTCALLEGGDVVCWGDNSKGQLGSKELSPPDVVTTISDRPVARLGSSLGDSTCAIDTNGIVGCWGSNSQAELGAKDAIARPGEVVWLDDLGEAVEVVVGAGFACARTIAGSVLCWGSNEMHQQGRWSTDRVFEPRTIPDPLTSTFINIDPLASYVRNVAANDPVVIDLEELGIVPGDTLDLTTVNFYNRAEDEEDDDRDLIAVFSSSDEIAGREETIRVLGAIDAGEDFESRASSPLSEPTDIPEDFDARIAIVTVPEGAKFLIVGVDDGRFDDNTDPNGDYALRITVLPEDDL